jgi:hypothetical protein
VLTPEVQKQLIDGVRVEVGSHSVDELAAERDEMLLQLIGLRTKVERDTPTSAKTVTAG